MVTINLDFDGYYITEWLPTEKHQCGGVYVVYTGKPTVPGKCSLREMLYIGKSKDISNRFSTSHHKYQDCLNSLLDGEQLYLFFADVDDEERAEAALIYHFKPPCNENLKDHLNCPSTEITVSGKKIFESFTV